MTRQQMFPIHFAAARAAQWHARQAVERAEHARELHVRLHMIMPRVLPADVEAKLFYSACERATAATVRP